MRFNPKLLKAIVVAAADVFAGDEDAELNSTKSLCKISDTFSWRGMLEFVTFPVGG